MTDKPTVFHIDEIPWVDLGGGHLDKAMVAEPNTGMIVNVSRYPKGYTMGWHTHTCAHGMYVIEGSWASRLRESTDFDVYDSAQYFQRALIKEGVYDALKEAGIQEGDEVRIDDFVFEWVE